ncbi:hypothetical protein IAT40_003697 [Kwoniella sp. CBS 6097]
MRASTGLPFPLLLAVAVFFVASGVIAVATRSGPGPELGSGSGPGPGLESGPEPVLAPGITPAVVHHDHHHHNHHHDCSKGSWWARILNWNWIWNWGCPVYPRGGPPGYPHGPGPGGHGRKFPSGLSDKGRERAQYIRTLFGHDSEYSEYDFGKIFAAPRSVDNKTTERTYATVEPLAKDLGIEIDIDCAESEASCIVEKIENFAATSKADILISWKHRELNVIATALGAPNAKRIYPDDR